MKQLYQYYGQVRIFDRLGKNFEELPIQRPFAIIADSYDEAQREYVDMLYRPAGYLTRLLQDDDPPDRFNIVFDKDPVVRPVEWDNEIEQYVFTDEPIEFQQVNAKIV